ncbi:hypothetical protein NQ314_012386 [Rhamnusium bicolor]|uniref:DDE Tnp4 domain-containing protein n=1 Tax=Rhamnusium bicolor TaxID=1586634 RepID=A0AAV8XD25_9CUCU|nr:hypothetical protein NQ314_012386 [Rhamnusium bicolor]
MEITVVNAVGETSEINLEDGENSDDLPVNNTADVVTLPLSYEENDIPPAKMFKIDVVAPPLSDEDVCVCLNFFGHGGYQTTVGEDLNLAVSQPAVSRIITNISNIITVHLLHRYVRFSTTDDEIRRVKQQFLENQNFPNAIGAIDGTHVAIFSPKVDDPIYPAVAYLNRKGYHSINVQAIFDANIMLLNVNARFPGATHDSGIWETSCIHRHLRRKYEEGRHNTWLLGDSGYPLQPWLMTPIIDAAPNTPEGHYTTRHIHARNVGERGNGVWKGRFRCLKRIARYNIPEVDIDDDDDNVEHDNLHQPVNPDVNILAEARIIRRRLVNQLAHN